MGEATDEWLVGFDRLLVHIIARPEVDSDVRILAMKLVQTIFQHRSGNRKGIASEAHPMVHL